MIICDVWIKLTYIIDLIRSFDGWDDSSVVDAAVADDDDELAHDVL